jgi:hypothetical protein
MRTVVKTKSSSQEQKGGRNMKFKVSLIEGVRWNTTTVEAENEEDAKGVYAELIHDYKVSGRPIGKQEWHISEVTE